MTDTSEDTPRFTTWFAEHSRGDVDREMAKACADVSEAVLALDKSGTVTLELKLDRLGSGALAVTAKVKTKKPDAGAVGVFFVGEDGFLTRSDPGALFHREGDAEASNPRLLDDGRVADGLTGEVLDEGGPELRVVPE